MNRVKNVNLLFCLIFSFIFLLGNIFSVQAATNITDIRLYEDQVLEKSLDPKHPDDEIVACKFSYITTNNGEQETIWRIQDIDVWIKNGQDLCWYKLLKHNYEISEDGTSAKIFLTIERLNGHFVQWFDGKFDLIFEFQVT